jgi:hypothetical protein
MRKASSLTGMRSNRESQGEQAAFRLVRWVWWACQDLNLGPHPESKMPEGRRHLALAGHAAWMGSRVTL